MKKTGVILLILFPIIGILYFMGPRLPRPTYNLELPIIQEQTNMNDFVVKLESKHAIKPGNEAEIVWAGKENDSTEYAIVYLHGFSASKEEGNPIHLQTAKNLQANLYLARLSDHGIDTVDAMINFTPERLWESGKQALSIGKKLGRKVILMGTSTGASLAIQLAAKFPNDVSALILLSPNIEINEKGAFLLNDPWGLQIARFMMNGKERVLKDKSEDYQKYWYTAYRLEAVVAVEEYIETTMHSKNFSAIKQPLLMLYYYKNEAEQDPVVKVEAMLSMFNKIGTPENKKFKKAIETANNHVIGSYITSKDLITTQSEINRFTEFLKTIK